MQAPFVDAAVSVDPVSRPNTFVSYYTWGSVLGVALDLLLRTRFDGLSLDDYMRALWERHGRKEVPYTVEDLEAVLARSTGDPAFAADFFRRHVHGSELPAFEALLAEAGLVLRKARPGRPILARTALAFEADGARVGGSTLVGSPLHRAGVDRGDVVEAVDGRRLAAPGDLEAVLAGKAPGDTVRIRYRSRGRDRTAAVALQEDPTLEVVTVEATGGRPTAAARALRERWLGAGGG
jgi:predicted metalloprotease with PDZ domain